VRNCQILSVCLGRVPVVLFQIHSRSDIGLIPIRNYFFRTRLRIRIHNTGSKSPSGKQQDRTHLMGVFSRTCSGSASSGRRLWRSSAAGSGQGSDGPAALARLAYNTLPRPWKSTKDWSFPPTAALPPARGCGVAAAAAPCLLVFLAEDRARLAPCTTKK
jgi:hypothetical protein